MYVHNQTQQCVFFFVNSSGHDSHHQTNILQQQQQKLRILKKVGYMHCIKC